MIGGVGLEEVLVAAVADAGRASLRADDAHRHGLADAERVADRQHDVADADLVRVADGEGVQVLRVDLQHREVARRIGADDLGVERALVRELDADAIRAFDDVVVGQDVAVGRGDDAGAEPGLPRRALLRSLEAASEELAEHRIVGQPGICVGTTCAFFSTRTVTTAGATFCDDVGVRSAGPTDRWRRGR